MTNRRRDFTREYIPHPLLLDVHIISDMILICSIIMVHKTIYASVNSIVIEAMG